MLRLLIDKTCEYAHGLLNNKPGYVNSTDILNRTTVLCNLLEANKNNIPTHYLHLLKAIIVGHTIGKGEDNPDFSTDIEKKWMVSGAEIYKNTKKTFEPIQDREYISLLVFNVSTIFFVIHAHYIEADNYKFIKNICDGVNFLDKIEKLTPTDQQENQAMIQWFKLLFTYDVDIALSITPEKYLHNHPIKSFINYNDFKEIYKKIKSAIPTFESEPTRLCLYYLVEIYNLRVSLLQEVLIKTTLHAKKNQPLPPKIILASLTKVEKQLLAFIEQGLFDFLKNRNEKSFILLKYLENHFSLFAYLIRQMTFLLEDILKYLSEKLASYKEDTYLSQIPMYDPEWMTMKALKELYCRLIKLCKRYNDADIIEVNGYDEFMADLALYTSEIDDMDLMLQQAKDDSLEKARAIIADWAKTQNAHHPQQTAAVSHEEDEEETEEELDEANATIKTHMPDPLDVQGQIKAKQWSETESTLFKLLAPAKQSCDYVTLAKLYSNLGDLYRMWSLKGLGSDREQKAELSIECYRLSSDAIDKAIENQLENSEELIELQAINQQYLPSPTAPDVTPAQTVAPKPLLVEVKEEQLQFDNNKLKLPDYVQVIIRKIKAMSANYQVYVVGGAVRAAYSKEKNAVEDFDLVTDAPMDVIVKIFNQRGKLVGNHYPVFLIDEAGHKPIQITLMATNIHSKETVLIQIPNGNTVVVHPTHRLIDDAKRRDFTVNAMYYDLIEHKVWYLKDTLLHLQRHTLVFIQPTEKALQHDPVLIPRAIRFCTRLEMNVSEGDMKLMRENAQGLSRLSPARYHYEMKKTLGLLNKERLYKLLEQVGVFSEATEKVTTDKKGYAAALLNCARFFTHNKQQAKETTSTPQLKV